MRVVATSDTHFPFDKDAIPDGDVFIHAGDLMYSGYVDEWHDRLDSLAALPHAIKLIVPGNHDFHIQNYHGVAAAELRRAGVRVLGLNEPIREVGGRRILGIPYVTGLRGWAFNVEEDWLYEYLMAVTDKPVDMVVSHAPAYAILDSLSPQAATFFKRQHVGSLAANRWFYKQDPPPKVWVHGHIHESYGRRTINGCTFYNVAMCDRAYEQVNPPMVIDL